jgi:TRAP-type mannitol/chloroaromatic compound transport system permease small subunit
LIGGQETGWSGGLISARDAQRKFSRAPAVLLLQILDEAGSKEGRGFNMPKAIRAYVRWVEAVNRFVGEFSMYIVLVMTAILVFESLSRAFFNTPHIWVVEIIEFLMAAYYLLGGGYSVILKGHVRMDLFYGRWSEKGKAVVDLITAPFFIFYVVFLLVGGLSGLEYALQYGQRNYTPWGPPLAPIKAVMVLGIILMLLQAVATFFRDLAKVRGEEL